jgi:tetratricopeptide (TPR) repeat protein
MLFNGQPTTTPSRRFESAAAMEAALAASITPPAQEGAGAARSRRPGIASARWWAAAALTLGAVVTVTALIMSRRPSPQGADAAPTPSATAAASPVPGGADREPLVAVQAAAVTPTLDFKGRDWVLITAFENRTGNAVLDGTLEFALESELSNSPFVNVVPRDRVEDTFALMRKPADTPLDLKVAREITARDSLIRAVVTGRVERLGPSYVLTSRIINPDDGAVIVTLSEDARQEQDLLPAVRRHSFRLRETLGEMASTIRRSEIALERVTTPSLRAAQLYSRAAVLTRWREGTSMPGAAEQFLTQAVAEDPDFASAHILLARVMRNLRRPEEDVMAHARRASELADRTSDIERYFIEGNYQLVLANSFIARGGQGDPTADAHLDRAISAFEALLRIKPDHNWGTEFLSQAYIRRRRQREAAEMRGRLADLRPNNLPLRWETVLLYFQQGDTERGRVHLRKARALNTSEYVREHPEYRAQIQQLETADAWLRLDVKRVRELADDFARQDASNAPQGNNSMRANLIGIYNSLGRYGDAHRAAEGMLPQRRDVDIGRVLFNAARAGKPGAKEALLAHLTTLYPNLSDTPAIPVWADALALVGRLDELRVMVERAKRDGYVLFNNGGTVLSPFRWFVQRAEGTLALAEGRVEEALRLFEESAKLSGGQGTGGQAWLIADAWIARGDLQRARLVLEQATGDWTKVITSNLGGFGVAVGNWIIDRERLAEVYRMLERHTEASAIEAQLLKLLAVAEEPNPMRQRLLARSGRGRDAQASRQ